MRSVLLEFANLKGEYCSPYFLLEVLEVSDRFENIWIICSPWGLR
ncbi:MULTISPECIES: hypothetical protein [unclassified Nodularia (in: cyanobacteria)]|nr:MULTISPECIES: hypothetical protein [unclassified Nodularia (in: cyanobacteria)]